MRLKRVFVEVGQEANTRGLWREEHVSRFKEHYPLGTMPRLAFDLALYTALQRAELRLAGPDQINGDRIRVREYRSGIGRMIPLHPRLKASIAAVQPGNDQPFIVSERGTSFKTDESFGAWFSRKCSDAGLPGLSIRGIRAVAPTRLLQTGLTADQIEAITGIRVEAERFPAGHTLRSAVGGKASAAGTQSPIGQIKPVGVLGRKRSESMPVAQRSLTNGRGASMATDHHTVPVQIRDDLFVRFTSVPHDLSRCEAEKICRVILALASPA